MDNWSKNNSVWEWKHIAFSFHKETRAQQCNLSIMFLKMDSIWSIRNLPGMAGSLFSTSSMEREGSSSLSRGAGEWEIKERGFWAKPVPRVWLCQHNWVQLIIIKESHVLSQVLFTAWSPLVSINKFTWLSSSISQRGKGCYFTELEKDTELWAVKSLDKIPLVSGGVRSLMSWEGIVSILFKSMKEPQLETGNNTELRHECGMEVKRETENYFSLKTKQNMFWKFYCILACLWKF